MKLTSIELHPAGSSDYAELSFRDPRRLNPYNVKDVDGLGADDIVRRFYQGSGSSGIKFYNLSQETRNVSFSIELNPNYADNKTPSDLRDSLYKMISSSRTGLLEIQFKNEDEVVAVISGFISKFEPELFDKSPGVKLSVECDGMLQAPEATEVDTLELDPWNTFITDPDSTAPHGFEFTLGLSEPTPYIGFLDPSWEEGSFQVTPVGGFLEDDILHFSSYPNNKQIMVIRGITPIYLADVVAPNSVWPILFPGENNISVVPPDPVFWIDISYHSTYWGV